MHYYQAQIDGHLLMPECRHCGMTEGQGEHYEDEPWF